MLVAQFVWIHELRVRARYFLHVHLYPGLRDRVPVELVNSPESAHDTDGNLLLRVFGIHEAHLLPHDVLHAQSRGVVRHATQLQQVR
jgi:hypothetical protein